MPKINRRDMLKLSGLAAGSLAVGSALPGCSSDTTVMAATDPTQQNSLLAGLPPYYPGTETLGAEEMRITFLGTTPIAMISQAAVSVFVELGNGECFVFDLGTGSMIKYWAMKINMDKMYKIFIAHLHADHMGDLPFVYGFGPSYGRLWPMYIWGPTRSGLTYHDPNGTPRGPYNDGTADYCALLEQMMVWHNESQSFESTSLKSYQGSVPVGFDTTNSTKYDAYDFVVKELPWQNTGKDANGNPNNIAYNYNGVKITHFPAVHTREGALSYKLEWTTPSGQVLSMIYAGDTLPSQYMIDQAKPGVDVLIHEIVVPAAVWTAKLGLGSSQTAINQAQQVQDSSHTPQLAYGYILQQIIEQKGVAPRLAIGTHFQATDDLINAAMSDIRYWYKQGDVTIASDTMVLNVTKAGIKVRRGVVSNYQWPIINPPNPTDMNVPKYWMTDPTTKQPTGAPQAQLDPNAVANYVIPSSKYSKK